MYILISLVFLFSNSFAYDGIENAIDAEEEIAYQQYQQWAKEHCKEAIGEGGYKCDNGTFVIGR